MPIILFLSIFVFASLAVSFPLLLWHNILLLLPFPPPPLLGSSFVLPLPMGRIKNLVPAATITLVLLCFVIEQRPSLHCFFFFQVDRRETSTDFALPK